MKTIQTEMRRIDIMKEKLKFFAANGKERTVYTVTEIGANEYKIQIKTGYSGICRSVL